jgi:hypothetical protein
MDRDQYGLLSGMAPEDVRRQRDLELMQQGQGMMHHPGNTGMFVSNESRVS